MTAAARQVAELKDDAMVAFGSEPGRRVLAHLAWFCGQNRVRFTADPYQLAFYEGQRSVYLRLAALIDQPIEVLLRPRRALDAQPEA